MSTSSLSKIGIIGGLQLLVPSVHSKAVIPLEELASQASIEFGSAEFKFKNKWVLEKETPLFEEVEEAYNELAMCFLHANTHNTVFKMQKGNTLARIELDKSFTHVVSFGEFIFNPEGKNKYEKRRLASFEKEKHHRYKSFESMFKSGWTYVDAYVKRDGGPVIGDWFKLLD